MKYIKLYEEYDSQHRLLGENIYSSEEEYRQALNDIEDLISGFIYSILTTDDWGRPLKNGFKPDENLLNNKISNFKKEIEKGYKYPIETLKNRAQTEKHKNAMDVIFNYHKKRWDKSDEKAKRSIDLTDQYKSGDITHKAKPGEVIRISPSGNWIYGEVYLTEGNDIAYHGGFINDLSQFMNKRKGLYLTRSLLSAWSWPGVSMKQDYRRVYEVKIKSNSLFIDSSPAGQDSGSSSGLEDEYSALTPMGIKGMSDENFRNHTHGEGEGTTGSEGLILDINAIESFRPIPFSELIKNDDLKSYSSRRFEAFSKWYKSIKSVVEHNFFRDEYLKKYPNDVFGENELNFYKSISKQVEDKIDSLSDTELKKLAIDNRLRW
jgi:hypothetical protein